MGAKFTASPDTLRTVLEDLNQRGLVYVEDGASARTNTPLIARQIGLSATLSDVIIDAVPSADAIDAALRELETLALERGVALGVTTALPISIERIDAWSKSLEEKGIYLVPVSFARTSHNTVSHGQARRRQPALSSLCRRHADQ